MGVLKGEWVSRRKIVRWNLINSLMFMISLNRTHSCQSLKSETFFSLSFSFFEECSERGWVLLCPDKISPRTVKKKYGKRGKYSTASWTVYNGYEMLLIKLNTHSEGEHGCSLRWLKFPRVPSAPIESRNIHAKFQIDRIRRTCATSPLLFL